MLDEVENDELIDEIKSTMDDFFENVSDEDFWRILKEIQDKTAGNEYIKVI